MDQQDRPPNGDTGGDETPRRSGVPVPTILIGLLALLVLALVCLWAMQRTTESQTVAEGESAVIAGAPEPADTSPQAAVPGAKPPEAPPTAGGTADGTGAAGSGSASGRQASAGAVGDAGLAAIHTASLSCPGSPEQAAPDRDGRFFGHLPYFDASGGDLQAPPSGFAGGTCTQLHGEAVAGLRTMMAAMRRSDPELASRLVGLSCFRSIRRQKAVFCSKADAGMAERARASAPPGFSEHHTGLAIDFGDRKVPGCNLSACFATTPVGAWLLANARSYGFELSFPAGNSQGVMYEPWHWRYVGGSGASVFARARSQFPAGGSFAANRPAPPEVITLRVETPPSAPLPAPAQPAGQQAQVESTTPAPVPANDGDPLSDEDDGVITEPPK